MVGGGVAAVARVVAIVLVGAGIGSLASLAGLRPLAFAAGVVAILVGGVFVLATNQATWLPGSGASASAAASQRRGDEAGELLGNGYGVAVVVGLIGTGLVLGSAIDNATVGVVIGLWGLLMLLLVRR